MRMYKRLGVLLAMVLCTVSLCGCDLFTVDPDQLLSPPQLTGDTAPIYKALEAAVSKPFTLKYPSSGTRRSAFVLEDINGDNVFEAFAFYGTDDGGEEKLHVNIIRQNGKNWISAGDQSIVAGGIERVDFCDLDNDGTKELLVGWQIYGNAERQLTVYSIGDQGLSQRLTQPYTSFLCCDLDDNDEDEIFIHLLDSSTLSNRAMLFSIDEAGISQTSGCMMDNTVKSTDEPFLSILSNGDPAIYIDEIKGAGAITEVLFFSKGELKNGLLDPDTLENSKTLRASSYTFSDINADGIPEIPVAVELPAANSINGEKYYYTKWCTYNGESLTSKIITVMNPNDSYYLNIPDKWLGNIAASKDTEKRVRSIYAYDPVTQTTGRRLASFRAVGIKDFDSSMLSGNSTVELCRQNDTVYIGTADTVDSALAITKEELKSIFTLYTQGKEQNE